MKAIGKKLNLKPNILQEYVRSAKDHIDDLIKID